LIGEVSLVSNVYSLKILFIWNSWDSGLFTSIRLNRSWKNLQDNVKYSQR